MTTKKAKEGIFKMLNGAMERLNQEQFIWRESWRKQKKRYEEQNPGAKVKYSYKTKQFTFIYDIPADLKRVIGIDWGYTRSTANSTRPDTLLAHHEQLEK